LWETLAECLDGGWDFFFHDFLILILFVRCLKILPGEGTSQEIHHDVPEWFKIISSSLKLDKSYLFYSQMCIYWSITCCSCKIFSLFIWDVFSILLYISFCQSKINYINFMCSTISNHIPLSCSNQEVIRLYISMQKMTRMNIFNSLNHLICQHQHRFQWKLPST
jgi:hypothetical protein